MHQSPFTATPPPVHHPVGGHFPSQLVAHLTHQARHNQFCVGLVVPDVTSTFQVMDTTKPAETAGSTAAVEFGPDPMFDPIASRLNETS